MSAALPVMVCAFGFSALACCTVAAFSERASHLARYRARRRHRIDAQLWLALSLLSLFGMAAAGVLVVAGG